MNSSEHFGTRRPVRSRHRSGNRPSPTVSIAVGDAQLAECQRLRWRVFAAELGARIAAPVPGHDSDEFDAYCRHVVVREGSSGDVIATTRLLLDDDAARIGRFYSETEFDLSPVLSLPGRFMEVGRTCIHPAHRNGAVLGMLWQGLARLIELHRVDYLIGCVSLPLSQGRSYVEGVMKRLRRDHYAPRELHVEPRLPLPPGPTPLHEPALPTLLRGYLRQGALACGEPCWDPSFNVADVFVLLDRDRLAPRYARRFLKSA